jgi:type III restriction enzyme
MRRLLGGWRDLVVINDEAHRVYGEKRGRAGDDPEHIKWSRILERLSKAARISLVIDLSATPWYGSGSAKPEGTLFEWLVSDFSVYDAFESGLVKVVRLPDPDGGWRHRTITLSPTNAQYSAIVLSEDDAEYVRVLAEFVAVLTGQ